METTEQEKALELAYLMLLKISQGQSFSALQYHGNLRVIKDALGERRATAIEHCATLSKL